MFNNSFFSSKNSAKSMLIYRLLFVLFFACIHVNTLLPRVPGLYLGTSFVYLDRAKIWSINSAQKGAGSYSFSQAWRSTLPSVVSSALTLYNFQTGTQTIFSFKSQFLAVATTYGTIEVTITPNGINIVYLAFSVVIIT